MTTTCQDLILRARSYNPLNASLTSDAVEMLTRIRSIQQRTFSTIASVSRNRFSLSASVTSTSGSSGRTVDLTALTTPLERVLRLTLGNGTEVSQVDELDTSAELAPRYFVRGQTLYEVSNDWSATSGPVTMTLLYAYGPTSININGSSSAINVSVPDEHIDVLILPLAMYLHQKDPGRDPAEYERLDSMYDEAWDAFTAYLTNFGGVESKRFSIPRPIGKTK